MKGIWETLIDEMGNHQLSDAQRAELASFHGHRPSQSQRSSQEELKDLMPWTRRPLPGIRTHY